MAFDPFEVLKPSRRPLCSGAEPTLDDLRAAIRYEVDVAGKRSKCHSLRRLNMYHSRTAKALGTNVHKLLTEMHEARELYMYDLDTAVRVCSIELVTRVTKIATDEIPADLPELTRESMIPFELKRILGNIKEFHNSTAFE